MRMLMLGLTALLLSGCATTYYDDRYSYRDGAYYGEVYTDESDWDYRYPYSYGGPGIYVNRYPSYRGPVVQYRYGYVPFGHFGYGYGYGHGYSYPRHVYRDHRRDHWRDRRAHEAWRGSPGVPVEPGSGSLRGRQVDPNAFMPLASSDWGSRSFSAPSRSNESRMGISGAIRPPSATMDSGAFSAPEPMRSRGPEPAFENERIHEER
jgi:hypothetical protein